MSLTQIVGAQRFSSEPAEGKARRPVDCEDRLELVLTHLDGVAVVTVRGEIDALTAPRFQDTIQVACELGEPVVLDMTRVTFMDSSGVSALIVSSQVAGELAGSVRIQESSAEVRRVLSIAGLDAMFLRDP